MVKIISVEGNIGSGKSTLVEMMKNILGNEEDIIFLQEPVDEWNNIKDKNGQTILEKFYADQEKYSFAFQMMAYITRLALLRKTVKENPKAIIVTERCLYTDKFVFAQMLYDDEKIEDVEFSIYLNWFNEFIDDLPVAKMVYINTLPTVCYERMMKRNRNGEASIELSYLEKCHDYHEKMVKHMKVPVLNIDGNKDNSEDNVYQNWIREIKDFIRADQDDETVFTNIA